MFKKNTHSFSHKRIKAALCAAMCSVLTAMPAFATGEDNSSTATTGTTVWTKADACSMMSVKWPPCQRLRRGDTK